MHRDTTADAVHDLWLGLVQAYTEFTLSTISSNQRSAIELWINSWPMTGFERKHTGKDFVHYHGSFKGHDYKLLVQYAVFLFSAVGVEAALLQLWDAVALVI